MNRLEGSVTTDSGHVWSDRVSVYWISVKADPHQRTEF